MSTSEEEDDEAGTVDNGGDAVDFPSNDASASHVKEVWMKFLKIYLNQKNYFQDILNVVQFICSQWYIHPRIFYLRVCKTKVLERSIKRFQS